MRLVLENLLANEKFRQHHGDYFALKSLDFPGKLYFNSKMLVGSNITLQQCNSITFKTVLDPIQVKLLLSKAAMHSKTTPTLWLVLEPWEDFKSKYVELKSAPAESAASPEAALQPSLKRRKF